MTTLSSMLLVTALLLVPASTRAADCPGQFAFFNHLLAVVDRRTADAIPTSRLLARYASLEIRTSKAAGQAAWTGRYIYGSHAYLELFGPGDSGDASAIGSLGVALGGDRAGVGDRVAARLTATGLAAETRTTRRVLGGRDLPWFTTVRVARPPAIAGLPDVKAWNVEFAREYLDAPEAARAPSLGPDDSVSRRRYLARSHRGAAFADVARIDLAMSAAAYRRDVAPLAAAAGFCRRERNAGARLWGGEAEIRVSFVAPERARLLRVDFALGTPAGAREQERIGRSRLTIGPGRRARWVFE